MTDPSSRRSSPRSRTSALFHFTLVLFAFALFALASTATSWAATGDTTGVTRQLDAYLMGVPELIVRPEPQEAGEIARFLRPPSDQVLVGIQQLAQSLPTAPIVSIDRLTGRPATIMLSGIPFIPGDGNDLVWSGEVSTTLPPTEEQLQILVDKAYAFLAEYPDLFNVPAAELQVNQEATQSIDRAQQVVRLDWAPHGTVVEGAYIVFRIRQGNLVQIGSELLGDAAEVPTTATLTEWQARAVLGSYLGKGKMSASARLRVLPLAAPAGWGIGQGVDYRLVWDISLNNIAGIGSWNGGVDASSGELLYFRDRNLYGRVEGKVWTHGRGSLSLRPMPYADYAQAPVRYTNGIGVFPATGSAELRSFLAGKYARSLSGCGVIDADRVLSGDLDLGGFTGMDCLAADIAGGGEGNTNAARTAFYYVNQVKETARGYRPGNSWLSQQLLAATDLSGSCNAYFDPSNGSINFLKSSGTGSGNVCGNFGEVDTIVYHETGHGLDANDGTGISGSTEAYADIVALLESRDSCIGEGAGIVCGADSVYSCPSCDGFREVDWARHSGGATAPIDIVNSCPFGGNPSAVGPCGKEPHCESAVSAEAMWDLAVRDLPASGLSIEDSWNLAESLWYSTTASSGLLHTCFGSNPGAGSSTLYTTLLVADDCDGNLANGTPHAPAIYAALARHGIASGTSSSSQNQANACSTVNVTLTSPQQGAVVSGTVTLAANASAASGIARVEFFANGQLVASDSSAPYSTTWSSIGAPSSTEIKAIAHDNSGNTDTATVTVTVGESNAPTCSLTSPQPGAVLDGTVTLRATASDSDGDVERVDFLVNGSVVGSDSSSPYSVSWNSDLLVAGSTATLKCVAVDDDGLTGTSAPVVVVTEGGFSIVIYDPVPGQVIGRNSGTLGVGASVSRPPGVSVRWVEFFTDGVVSYRDYGEPFSYAIGASSWNDGDLVTFVAKATLGDDSVVESPPVTIVIDGILPSVQVTSPAAGTVASGTLTVTGSASDAHGIDRVTFTLNGSPCTDYTAPYTCTFNTLSRANGSYNLQAKAWDKPGNLGYSSTVPIQIFNPAEIEVTRDWDGAQVLDGSVVDLPPTVAGFERDYSLTIKNLGRDPLVIDNPGSLLSASSCISQVGSVDSSLAYQGSTVAEIHVDCPAGQHQVTMTINNNDPDEDPFNVTLRLTVSNAPVCQADGYHLCLQNGRFRVNSTYQDPNTGQQTAAHAVPFSTGVQTGFFWFFGPDNLESVVKILDAQTINNSFWVFHGGATHVEYTLHVEDLYTGDVRDFTKPDGSFCGGFDIDAFPQDALPPSPDALNPEVDKSVTEGQWQRLLALPDPPADVPLADGTHADAASLEKAGACVPSSTVLCLQNNRFALEVDWIDHTGQAGVGKAITGTTATGFFWFFGSGNIELMIKVLDGRGVNDYWWVYYGSLSQVDFTIRVTDTQTGLVATYHNPAGTYCGNGDPWALPEL